MRSATRVRSTARPGRSADPVSVTAYVHRARATAWIDVGGDFASPTSLRTLLSQLRRAHRRLPRGIDVVGLDLTPLDEITVDLAALLSLESRMLGLRDMKLALALRHETDTQAARAVHPLLEPMLIWRIGHDRLEGLSRTARAARRGERGWSRLGDGDVTVGSNRG